MRREEHHTNCLVADEEEQPRRAWLQEAASAVHSIIAAERVEMRRCGHEYAERTVDSAAVDQDDEWEGVLSSAAEDV